MTAWQQILSGLPSVYNRWYDRILPREERLTLELLWHEGTVQFYVTTPTRVSTQVQQLIAGWLPESLLIPQTSDPLANMMPQAEAGETVAVATLKPTSRSFQLLTTVFPKDPLVGLYAGMAALPPYQTAVLQLVLTPTIQTLKEAKAAEAPTETNAEGKPPIPAVVQKAFDLTWRIAITGPEKTGLRHSMETIASSFDIFTGSDAQFFSDPWIRYGAPALKPLFSRRQSLTNSKTAPANFTAAIAHPAGIDMATIPNIEWGKFLAGEPPAKLPVVDSEMTREEKQHINPFATTVFRNRQVVYGLERTDRRRHMYVIGKTGTGKSTLLANMAVNDLRNNEGMCIIDPHGDLVENLLNYIPSHRINDVIYFDPSDMERTVKLNLFEGKNVAHRELIASGIVSVFKKLYGYSWGPRLEYILRNALLTLLKSEEARLSDITDLLTDGDYRKKVVETIDDPILRNFWLNEFNAMQERQRTEAVAPILNKVGQFVSSPLIRDVVNARKSSFSIEDVMDQGKILLVNLSQGRLGEDNATLLGAMLITKIQLAAMARVHIAEEDRRDFYLYVDEFQNFATESFSKILSEARKYRLALTLANQYTAQIPEEVQKAIFGNCGSVVAFVMGADDADIFSKEFSGKYTPHDLVSLQRHQIINRLTIDNVISEAFPAHTLPLASKKNNNRNKVLTSSRERYAKKKS